MQRSLIAVALLLLAPLVSAQVYKWTDASGTVHYTEAPPAQGTKFNKVTTTGRVEPLAPPANAPQPSAETPAGLTNPPAPLADTPENRKTFCDTLETNLTTLKGSAAVVEQKGDKTTALNADQRQQQLTTAQSQYDQYCKAQ